MPNLEITKLTVPVDVSGVVTNVTYDIKDATARQMIADLGNALYWVGVTTTELTNGATTNPITVGGESVTARVGAIAQYSGEEFAWNGTAWQSLGRQDFGDLAFKNSVEANYTPQGEVSVSVPSSGGGSVRSITSVGTLPTFEYDSSNEALTFNAGTLPTQGNPLSVVLMEDEFYAEFTGTQATIVSD